MRKHDLLFVLEALLIVTVEIVDYVADPVDGLLGFAWRHRYVAAALALCAAFLVY